MTLYLDSETEAKMKSAAKEAGTSVSKWVVDLIRARTAARRPASVARLAGAWADIPEVEELRSGLTEDVPREPL